MKNILIAFVCCLLPMKMTAQADHDLLQTMLTDIVSQGDEEEPQDVDQLLELLEALADHPVHVNQADHDELSRLFWLTEFQINSLLDHVKTKGAILSHYEIAYLYGFTPELVQSMLPFISLEHKPETRKIKPETLFRYGKHKLMIGAQSVLQAQKGYVRPDSVESRYYGSPLKTYLRYAFESGGRLSFGLTAEKDAGEAFFKKNNPYGYDFYSGHFQLQTKGFLKTLTVGDFRADFGQGLILWSGLNYGKTAMLLNAMRYNEQLRKYASAGENRFLRGLGATFRMKPLDVTIFYSRKAIDATVATTDENGKVTAVTAFPNTGYHRTLTEIAQKNRVTEQIAGGNISLTRSKWHIGATAVHYVYDAALAPKENIYNYFAFSGTSNSNYSLDFRFRLGDALFYGEQAVSRNKALGSLLGIQMLVTEHFTANILYRRYAKDFQALYGMAFGENTRNNNEEGFYVGWSWSLGGLWRVASYVDMFRFPWLRYRTDAPSFGQDAFIQVDYVPARETKLYLQGRYKEKEENQAGSAISATVPVQTTSAKLVFAHQATDFLRIGNQVEVKRYQKDQVGSSGYLLSQSLRATIPTFGKYPLTATFCFAIFDTDDYNARIYSYESDMLYAFSIPAFYDRGTHVYLLLRYAIGKYFDFRVKYSATRYTDKTVIGSGLSEIQGNRHSEWKAQWICKF
jgi:hypothetical protein